DAKIGGCSAVGGGDNQRGLVGAADDLCACHRGAVPDKERDAVLGAFVQGKRSAAGVGELSAGSQSISRVGNRGSVPRRGHVEYPTVQSNHSDPKWCATSDGPDQ